MLSFMDNKRVLIYVPGFALFGQEQALIGIGRALIREDIDCHFLLHGDWGENIARHLDELDFKYSYLTLGTNWSLSIFKNEKQWVLKNILSLFRASVELRSIMKNGDYSCIIGGNATYFSYLLLALYTSKVNVIFRHGDELAAHSWFHRLINFLIIKRADKHVFNCDFLRLKFNVGNEVRSSLIYNCPMRFDRIDESAGGIKSFNSATKIKLLFIGQLSEYKGIFVLMDAFRRLANADLRVSLDIVGAFPGYGSVVTKNVESPLNELIASYPGRVMYHGFLDDPQSVFANADILVVPSIWDDPSPNIVLEAKAFGLPAVGFPVGGIPEIIAHKVDGYVCKHADLDSLMEGLEWMMSDLDRLGNIKKATYQNFIKNFGKERFSREWLNVLQSVD